MAEIFEINLVYCLALFIFPLQNVHFLRYALKYKTYNKYFPILFKTYRVPNKDNVYACIYLTGYSKLYCLFHNL